jgi:hypothetical protein
MATDDSTHSAVLSPILKKVHRIEAIWDETFTKANEEVV